MKLKNNYSYISLVLMNLGVIVLVGFALYFTKSLWSFLGLFFLFYTKASVATCPKCGHTFTIKKEDNNND